MMEYDLKKAFPEPTEGFHKRVTETLENLPEKKERMEHMERQRKANWSIKKAAVATLVAVMALGTTVFAAGKVNSYVGSTSTNEVYTKMPTAEQIKTDYGFSPKLVETFTNGYTFSGATAGESEALDEEGNSLGESENVDLTYAKDEDVVDLSIEGEYLGIFSEEPYTEQLTYNGVTMNYMSQDYKIIPEGYEMTEQDKADEASGRYVFSCDGGSEVRTNNFQSVLWLDGGIEYMLMVQDSDISEDELVQMAHEVIDGVN